MKGSRKYTAVWDGLWSQKHVEEMGSSIFLFGFFLSKANSKGQIQITYQAISNEMGVPVRTLGCWMNKLKKKPYITVKKTDSMSIQIVNFRSTKKTNFGEEVMQDVAEPKEEVMQELAEPLCKPLPNLLQNPAEPKPVTSNEQSVSGKALNTLNIKEKDIRPTSKKSDDSKLNKKRQKPRCFIYSQEDKETAFFFLGKIQNIRPNFKEPNIESWANDIRLMREQDKRTHEEIKSLFSWANSHPFWRANILSPAKLRDQFDRLSIEKTSNGNGYRSQADHNSSSSGRVVV